jgi:predicted metal-dependent hydrolase
MLYGELEPSAYPGRYKKGVWLFNNRHFFECHEILEAQWMETIGTEKTFYQMIIHAAVAFVHWENGNRKGVLSLHHTFKMKAAAIPADAYMGLDIARLKQDMAALIEPLRADMNLPLPPFAEVVTPVIHISGFEPVECNEHEMLVLGRHIKED